MSKKINIQAFLEKFLEEYEFLYENHDNVPGFQDAVEAFDESLVEHPIFIADFARYRGDPISSDREAAAFMFALDVLSEEEEV